MLEIAELLEEEADSGDPSDLRLARVAKRIKDTIADLDKQITEVENQMFEREFGTPIADVWLSWMRPIIKL